MRCLLHIGTEKTGTTLLQEWLYANRAALSAHGFLLADTLERNNNRKLAAYFQAELDDYHQSRGIHDAAARDAYFAGFEDAFAREVAAGRGQHHTMIISSEHFHSRVTEPGRIVALRDFLLRHFSEVRIVCYFREQSEMLRSLYSTALRVSHTTTIEEFQRSVMGDYCDFEQIARRWASAFGAECCDFRLYDRSRMPGGDIRMDVLARDLPGLEAEGLDFDNDDTNPSLSRLEASLYRLVNQYRPLFPPGGRMNEGNLVLKRAISARESLRVGTMANPLSDHIRALYADSNQRFAQRWFGGQALFPAAADAPADDAESPRYSLVQVEAMLTDLLSAILEACPDHPVSGD